MDRLNQLRGDAGASQDSTLDTSSVLGEGYVTANDGSKYFSLSEVDSSSTDSPSKGPADDITAVSSVSHAENIISDLSPIPKKSELETFKIGEQIEAANILSGGVNIFEDNENSYDGDELVIDDAATEGDDKLGEIKLDQNEMAFEKTDRLPDTNMEDTDAASPSKDTEVVLQIDGKNVDAIDIGNGLYLYRKDGEEELAAVQILQDHLQQPNIKFLKVRENSEGNLEVYEEIEIEVPKEAPSKDVKPIKNTSHIPIKDINKVSEPISNRVAEKKSQAAPKDTPINTVEDINKDNSHIESRTEVNLNGKMMKFSESRKSPLIGTFTPMTFHSTPNKEGIPLTKTMVDLQLHPNRHSENVKKTIEVHTDNCKQKMIETPTKSTKDSYEHNRSLDLSSLSDKNSTNSIIIHGAEQTNPECNIEINQSLTENKTDVIIPVEVKENKKNNDKKIESNVDHNKTDIVDTKIPIITLETSLNSDATGKLNISPVTEGDSVKSLTVTTPLKETSSKINIEVGITKNHDQMKDNLQIAIVDICNKYTASENVKVNNEIIQDSNTTIEKKQENKNDSSGNVVLQKTLFTKSQDTNNDIMINTVDSRTDQSKNPLKTTEIISNEVAEKLQYVEQSQCDIEVKDMCNENKLNPVEALDTASKLKSNPEMKQENNPLETISNSTKDIKLATNMNTKKSELVLVQTLKSPCDAGNPELSAPSELLTSQTEMEMLSGVKPSQPESVTPVVNLKPAEIKTDSVLSLAERSVNSEEKESKSVSELRKQEKTCKMTIRKEEKIKSNTTFKPFKNENSISNIDSQSSSLKVDDNSRVNEMEPENKNRLEKISKDLVKKVDGKSNQLEIMSSKVNTDVTKTGTCGDAGLNIQDSVTNNQTCNRNLSSFTKGNNVETQKKNELKQKLSMSYKNTKLALLTSDSKFPHASKNISTEAERNKNDTKKELTKVNKVSVSKPVNNNKTAVPFGMWTEANRQEFLNKIKESKVPINTSNTKQLKQPNDLNRRDVLQKIDSQRQSNNASSKVQELNILNKMKLKNETTAFTSKSNIPQKDKLKDNKISAPASKIQESVSNTPVDNTTVLDNKVNKEQPLPVTPADIASTASSTKKDSVHRKEINNQDLIDKTIEGIINRAVTAKLVSEDGKQDVEPAEKPHNVKSYKGVSLDEIESKMNELHGIPFVERPPHELPKVFEHENKSVVASDVVTINKSNILPSATPLTNKPQQKNQQKVNQPVNTKVNEESDEEIIEYEPVTGDVQLNKNNTITQAPVKDKIHPQKSTGTKINCDSKKEKIITENDFDKFARRNSITYENCLTVKFDSKEHNVVQTVVEKETVPKKLSRNEIMLAESKAKSHKQLAVRHINLSSKIPTITKATQEDNSYNKSYQSKVQLAYQTVMTAKRQQECPITIIEDKPVKVVFMDGNHEYIPHQLNVQGKELSPPKKSVTEWDHFTHSNSESLDSDILDSGNDSKSQDDIKFKSRHQRKQVLTPVEAPDLELIEPSDLGIEVSPKKKRKVEDTKSDKNSKSLVPKKTYLLNRNIQMDDAPANSQNSTPTKDSVNQQDGFVKHKDSISAIDNLVKAAELLETQSENKHSVSLNDQNSVVQQNSPVKRGRGRPRKYPLPEPGSDNKVASTPKTPIPQKKPRLIDAKAQKHDTESEDDEINSDGELVKENWTMGKINENIVCPICNKLFRSENVVFKHVKHCTGPSPSRSDSDKRSPRRMRQSQDFDWKSDGSKSDGMDVDEDYELNKPTTKRKSNEKRSSLDNKSDNKIDVIVIEDTPIKGRESPVRKRERLKNESNKTIVKPKVQHGVSSLVCEFCGKTFRQLSYLVSHKLQHKNTDSKSEKDHIHKSLFSCEICKKEFRKLHHLVQHRIIHNPNSMRTLRKSSSEQNDNKTTKEATRATEDQSAGFRCEPCDKSFRKLHHLVEHRETHDEINKKCNPVTTIDTTKPTPLHHCDVCKKTFKKQQHLIEHKEHHLDTSSEKSDDKSVKSSLSTKDIIHECPLCYMVFPNEHSLNKHHIICQRKKKQSAAKQAKKIDANDAADVDGIKVTEIGDENLAILQQKADADTSCVVIEDDTLGSEKQDNNVTEAAKCFEQKKELEFDNETITAKLNEPVEVEIERKGEINEKLNKSTNKKDGYERNADIVSVKSKKHVEPIATPIEIIKIPDTPTPKKKYFAKDKIGATVTKRQKVTNEPLSVVHEIKTQDSSDDDEIRYMLNPDFHVDESNEGKLFMKVRAKKRNSLQIERPNSKDLMKRRISLQHPPKIPRLKVKPIVARKVNTNTVTKYSKTAAVKLEPQVSTDSDDSDVKYSFPEPFVKETKKEAQGKLKKQKIVQKRKSLNSMGKRKSLGKMIRVKQKANPSPAKQAKKRTTDVEHRCDCGQLFSSAALLTRHTSLAHTPPRIRRRRSPPPDNDKPSSNHTEKCQDTRKTIIPVPSKSKTGVTTRKSSINTEVKATPETTKTPKTASLPKTRRSTAHKGVPVPDKMRKVMDKFKK